MSSAAGCLRDITATDIMDYMQVDHPHNLKEMWKMKHATPARIGIGHCGEDIQQKHSFVFWLLMQLPMMQYSMKYPRKL